MPRRQKKTDAGQEMQAKGGVCMVAGFILLFVPVPVLGKAPRPFSWVAIDAHGLLRCGQDAEHLFAQYQKGETHAGRAHSYQEFPGH